MWEFIDKIIYINLDHRQDRRDIMKIFFEKGGIPQNKIVRFPAIKTTKGAIGCLKSHTYALQMAKNNGWTNVLILEDDLEWLNLEEEYPKLEELTKLPRWDVIHLVGWYVKHDLPRTYYTLNAGAYLVNGHYYDTLLANRYESVRKITSIQSLYSPTNQYTADTYWNKLAEKDFWYGLHPCICHQVSTYSDNNEKIYRADLVHGIYNPDDKAKFFSAIQNAEQ